MNPPDHLVTDPAPPRISVVICAYTMARWPLTLLAIESVRQQSVPAELVVVVDHNPELLARFRAHDPQLRVIENSQPAGLSGGRNTGVAATSGAVIAFLDDDAQAEPEWLASMLRHFERAEVVAAGTRVDPAWIGAQRRWFPAEFLWVVGCSYRGQPQVASPVRNITGGGMAIRRSAFERAGGFSSLLGRTRSRLPLGGEETEWCLRARERVPGAVVMYEPAVGIAHHVPAERASWSYLCRRCYAEGLSKSTLTRLVQRNSLSSEWHHTLVVLPRGVLRGLADTVLRLDPAGLGRAAAIVLGFGCAVAGYAIGRLTRFGLAPAGRTTRWSTGS